MALLFQPWSILGTKDMQLSVEQLETLDRGHPVAVQLDGRERVVLKRDVFEVQRTEMASDWPPATMQRQMADMLSDDWTDPAMSIYDDE